MMGKLKTFYQLKEENKAVHDFMIRSGEHTFDDQVAVMRAAYSYNKEMYSDSDVCNNIKSTLSMGSNGKEYVSNQLEYAKSQYKSALQPTKDWVKWAFETATNKNFDDYKVSSYMPQEIYFYNIHDAMHSCLYPETAAVKTFYDKIKLIGHNEMIADGIFEDNDVSFDIGYGHQKNIDTDSYIDSFMEGCTSLNADALAKEINSNFEDTFDIHPAIDVDVLCTGPMCY